MRIPQSPGLPSPVSLRSLSLYHTEETEQATAAFQKAIELGSARSSEAKEWVRKCGVEVRGRGRCCRSGAPGAKDM